MNIDELKAKLPEGIWALSGGNLGIQRLLKNTYAGNKFDEKLKLCMAAMKLKLIGDDLWVILIHANGEIGVSKINIPSFS